MKDFKILKFLDKLKFVYEQFGVDYELMRKILKIKLTMDGRRVPSVLANSKNTKERSSFKNTLLAYGFTGLFIMMFIFTALPLFIKMSFILGMIIFMIMATMISDFSSVLLDLNDKNILMSKPIDSKTINAARLTHIFIYLSTISFVISGPSLIAFCFKYGLMPGLIFLIEIFFIVGFVIFFTAILYFIVLIFFNGERLKDIINYFQIFLSIAMIISYQLIGRMFDLTTMNIVVRPRWWHYLIPSTWFAAPYTYLFENKHDSYYLCLSILGIIIPIVAFIIYLKYVTTYFEKNLQKLNENSIKRNSNVEKKEKLHKVISKIVCRDKVEGSFYRFSHNMLGNERKLKLKIYPNLAYAVIFPFILLLGMFRDSQSINEVFMKLSIGKYYLSIYASLSMLIPSILFISRSEDYSGAWIYKVLPIETPGAIIKGAMKAFMFKCVIPIEGLVSIIFLILCGPKILPQIILIFLNMIFISILIINQSKKVLPFSRDFKFTDDNSTGMMMGLMVLCAVLAGVQFLLDDYWYALAGNILLVLVLIIIFWRRTFKISWEEVR